MKEFNHFESPETAHKQGELAFYDRLNLSRFDEMRLDSSLETDSLSSLPQPDFDLVTDEDKIRKMIENIHGGEAIAIAPSSASIYVEEKAELNRPIFRTRRANKDDIDAMVDLDLKGFQTVYQEYGKDQEELRAELRGKFEGRMSKIDLDWVRIAEENGKPCGFIMSCPTAKSPEDFVSWEETTDNGTLENTYNPDGPYIYVVSLTMPRPESGQSPKNMLFVDQIGKLMQKGYKAGYFESRLPGLRNWMAERCVETGQDFSQLTDQEKFELASEYTTTKVEVNGKQVLLDPHLRMYRSIGCKLLQLVPDAYQDGPSMNFGVVAVYENPLPPSIRKNRVARNVAGSLVRMAGKSHGVVKRLF
jgi:hypothetical protein